MSSPQVTRHNSKVIQLSPKPLRVKYPVDEPKEDSPSRKWKKPKSGRMWTMTLR